MKSEIEHTSTMLGSQNMKSSQRMVSVVEPYELPEGWKWCRLPECVSIVTGKKDANYGTPDGKYLFFTCAEQPLRCDDYSFEGESLLLPGNGANVGQVIYYDGQFEVYQRTYVLQKTNESILLKYLYYHILGFWKNYNLDKQYGSATNYIKMGNFLNYHFPLPPTLAEQQRIVNRIESMFAKLDEAKEKAQNVVDGFETRKAAILHKAFTGELTAKWRKENGVCDDSWEEKTIGEISSKITDGEHSTPKRVDQFCGYYLLSARNIHNGEIRLDDVDFVTENEYERIRKRCNPNKNDILISCSGSIGRVCVIQDNNKYVMVRSAAMVKLLQDNPFYIAYMLQSFNVQQQIEKTKKQSCQANLFLGAIKRLLLPVPTLPEQVEIVRILDIIIEKENKAKQAAEAVLEQIDLLKKSILARAFRGEL